MEDLRNFFCFFSSSLIVVMQTEPRAIYSKMLFYFKLFCGKWSKVNSTFRSAKLSTYVNEGVYT